MSTSTSSKPPVRDRPPSRSASDGLPDKTFKMHIESYSESKKLANGSSIKSPKLDAGGHSWYIVYYPNGRLAGTTDSISLYLQLDAAGEGDVHVEYQFMLHAFGGRSRFMSAKVVGAVNRRRNAHGFERFVTRDDLEISDFAKRDRFTILCDVTVLPKAQESDVETPLPPPPSGLSGPCIVRAPPSPGLPEPSTVGALLLPGLPEPSTVGALPLPGLPEPSIERARAPPSDLPESSVVTARAPLSSPQETSIVRARAPPSGLQADLARLLATKEGADVDFEVGGMVFSAHRSVLAARSSVFKADFFGPMKEEDTTYIRINDMHPEAFEALLHFIYTDSLPETNTTAREAGEMAMDLLVAADRYDLKGLNAATENKLCNHIDVSTVLSKLALAEQHQCRKLKKKCLKFIASRRNTSAVMATDGVEHLARDCPSVVGELVTKILDKREATLCKTLRRTKFFLYCVAFVCFLPCFLNAVIYFLSEK